MNLTREERLKRDIQKLLDQYADRAKCVPKVEIVGYCVIKVTSEPFANKLKRVRGAR